MTVGQGGGGASGPGRSGRNGNPRKRDSIGMHFLSRGSKQAPVYEGRTGDFEDVNSTQIRPGSAVGNESEKEEDGIQVVTVVEQDSTPVVTRDDVSGRSDSESTRKLVREFPS